MKNIRQTIEPERMQNSQYNFNKSFAKYKRE